MCIYIEMFLNISTFFQSFFQLKFKALENIMISEASNGSAFKKLENAMITVDEQGRLCEPIRKQAAVKSPMKCLSPAQVVSKSHKL